MINDYPPEALSGVDWQLCAGFAFLFLATVCAALVSIARGLWRR